MTGGTHRDSPVPRRAKAAESRTHQTKTLVERSIEDLADALDAGESEKLKTFLKAMGRFHRYSFQNVMLIVSQRSDATRVAGFHTWKSFGRTVKKGEKGIAIFAPMRFKKESDNGRGTRKLGDDEETVLRFRVVYVFDIAQTEGDLLPGLDRVTGDPGDLVPRLEYTIRDRGIELIESDDLGGADGVSRGGSIAVLKTLPSAERFGVLVHELAHELLHKDKPRPPKSVRETEAEAVAHVVCDAFGLEVGSASADYIRLYQGDRELLTASLDRIQKTACTIIEAIKEDQPERNTHESGQTASHESDDTAEAVLAERKAWRDRARGRSR